MGERFLSFLGADRAGAHGEKLRAYESVLVVVIATELWCEALLGASPDPGRIALALAATLSGLATFRPDVRRLGFLGLAALHVFVLWRDFPFTGNHRYLEVMLCGLAACMDPLDEDDGVSYLAATRWLVVVVFFYSGLQKLVHGYYFRGLLLAHTIVEPTFQPVIAAMMPEAEAARLLGYERALGAGPYLVDAPVLLVASNAVYLVEIALAGLLLVPRLRGLAVAFCVAFLVGVEAAARELFFGSLFVNGLLLFAPGAVNRRFVPVFVGLMLLLLSSRLGLVPEVTFY